MIILPATTLFSSTSTIRYFVRVVIFILFIMCYFLVSSDPTFPHREKRRALRNGWKNVRLFRGCHQQIPDWANSWGTYFGASCEAGKNTLKIYIDINPKMSLMFNVTLIQPISDGDGGLPEIMIARTVIEPEESAAEKIYATLRECREQVRFCFWCLLAWKKKL